MLWKLLLAVPGPTQTWMSIGFGVYGLARLFVDLTRIERIDRKTVEDIIVRVVANVMDDFNTDPREVILDFDRMQQVYAQFGELGLYAYLIENSIVKDSRHGDFIIKCVFLPYLEEQRKNRREVPEGSPIESADASLADELDLRS